MNNFDVPVLLIIFNRIDTAEKVLQEIRNAGVSKLYIFCDGPRIKNPNEDAVLKDVQEKLLKQIDWPCEVKTNFYQINKGPRIAVGEAITWFFEQEESGIVFEHDCLPHPSFFGFCKELLERYKDDERIMHIGGNNFQFGKKYGDASYYFSRYNHIWGFATWRRAWKYYDNSFSAYPEFVEKGYIHHIFSDSREIEFWLQHFKWVHEGKIETWDAQWTLAMWLQNGLAILPQVNLVSNIGFGENSLNTKNLGNKMAAVPLVDIGIIKHPKYILPDMTADAGGIHNVFYPSYIHLFKRKLYKFFGRNI